jgi:hypothetical protein
MSKKRIPRSRRPRHAMFFGLLGLVSALSTYGCATLDRLSENVCGNRVIEEANGEDCDGDDEHVCGKAGTASACRYLCSAGNSCPPGFGCGADAVCRRPSGEFEPLLTKTSATTVDLLSGDTNADGCYELIRTTSQGTYVTGFDSRHAGFCSASTQILPARVGTMDEPLTASPFVTELSGNAQPELVLTGQGPLNPGLRVASSDAKGAGELVSLLYPTEEIPERGVRMLKIKVPGADNGARDAVLLFLGAELKEPGPLSPTCAIHGGMPDGGTPDGGMPDGGMMMPDGGLPPPDGGLPPPDGGLPPPDGGLPPPDGGLPPPDGGLPPPDGGLPPPDGGLPPPPPAGEMAPDTVRVAIIDRPEQNALEQNAALPGGDLNTITALAASDDIDLDHCAEIAVGRGGATEIEIYRVCAMPPAPGEMKGDMYLETLSKVALDNNAALRFRNASVLLSDVNADGLPDLVANANDCTIHVAYGDGHGAFGSMAGTMDGVMTTLQVQQAELLAQMVDPHSVLAAGHFGTDAQEPDGGMPNGGMPSGGPVRRSVIGVICNDADTFDSDVCAAVDRGCEAHVADLDRDGLDDVVIAGGQQVGLVVGRSNENDKGFHIALLDTECPPHDIAIGDFDDDGINDIAFFDQTSVAGGGATSAVVKIAYGRPYQTPEEPKVAGLIDNATGLVSGRFTPENLADITAPTKMFAARSLVRKEVDAKGETQTIVEKSAIGLIATNNERQALGLFYVPKRLDNDPDTYATLEILAVARGHFVEGSTAEEIAMIAREPGKGPELWRVRFDATKGTLVAERSSGDNPMCSGSCVLTAMNADGEGLDELLLFDSGTLTVYSAAADGFSLQSSVATSHTFVSIEDTMKPPAKYVARPLVTDLDPVNLDQPEAEHLDVILRDREGVIVAFWGNGDGTFEEKELFKPGTCTGKCAVARIREGKGERKRVALVGPGVLKVYELAGREPVEVQVSLDVEVPDMNTDFVAISAADVDGDGVDDLSIMTSGSAIHVLRGKPVNE